MVSSQSQCFPLHLFFLDLLQGGRKRTDDEIDLAKSVSHFHMMKSAEHARRVFRMIQGDPKVSILGMNDDIESDYDEVRGLMNEWFEMRWPRKAVWERDWDPVKDRYND